MVTSADIRTTTLICLSVQKTDIFLVNLPRLAQSHICDAVFVPKTQIDLAKIVELSSIKPHILSECLTYKVTLIERRLSFSGHIIFLYAPSFSPARNI